MSNNELEVMAQKNEQKKVTIEQLIAKAKKMKETQTQEVYFKSLDATLTIKKVDEAVILRGLDRIGNGEDMAAFMDVAKELIYNSCDILRNKELQETFECVEPYDIVEKVLTMSERTDLYAKILAFNGFDESDIGSIIKNA